MNMSKKHNKDIWIIAIGIIILEALFFRHALFSDVLFGDNGDGLLNNLFTEHWYQVLLGNEKWNQLIAFYPIENTISYSDMDLGFAFPYIIFRFFGMNMYLSNKISLMILHVWGSSCLSYFLHKQCKITSFWTLVGVVVFSCSGSYTLLFGHSQMFAVSYIPFIIVMSFSYFNEANVHKRVIYAVLAVTSVVLLFYTAFYVAFYLGIYLISGVVIGVCYCLLVKREYFTKIFAFFKNRIWEIFCYAFWGAFLMIPFFKVYLPTMKLTGGRAWKHVLNACPKITQLIDYNPNTLLYGWLYRIIDLDAKLIDEGGVSFSIISIVLFVGVIINYIVWNKKRKEKTTEAIKKMDLENGMVIIAVTTTIFAILSIVRFGDFSIWYIFYKLIPGARVIRAVYRYNLFLHIPLAILVAYLGNKVKIDKKSSKFIATIVFMVLLLSNLKQQECYRWTISGTESELEKVAAMPQECEAIYGMKIGDTSTPEPYLHMKMWNIAFANGVKTLNGYSGNIPYGWTLYYLKDPRSIERAWNYIAKNELRNVYFYDMNTDEWIASDQASIRYLPTQPQGLSISENMEVTDTEWVIEPGQSIVNKGLQIPEGNYEIIMLGQNVDQAFCNVFSDSMVLGDVLYNTKTKKGFELKNGMTETDTTIIIQTSGINTVKISEIIIRKND